MCVVKRRVECRSVLCCCWLLQCGWEIVWWCWWKGLAMCIYDTQWFESLACVWMMIISSTKNETSSVFSFSVAKKIIQDDYYKHTLFNNEVSYTHIHIWHLTLDFGHIKCLCVKSLKKCPTLSYSTCIYEYSISLPHTQYLLCLK